MKYVVVSGRAWYDKMVEKISATLNVDVVLIKRKEELTLERLREINPRYVFVPHWSYIIPAEIHQSFECVIFHMTDLPFGRGGSPLQNLISRGIYDTKISALRCETGLDSGPIYMKRPFSLYGTAEEIYLRAARVIEEMIMAIITNEPEPVPQQGEAVCFSRRKPQDSDMGQLKGVEKAFDHIRMLDAEGYPNAFIETDFLRFEFTRPSLRHGQVLADVKITKKV